jgi:hypothetical protein
MITLRRPIGPERLLANRGDVDPPVRHIHLHLRDPPRIGDLQQLAKNPMSCIALTLPDPPTHRQDRSGLAATHI